MSGEFERIREIRRRLFVERADVAIGIGDDAAVLAPSTYAQVLSVDAQVEGVHFRREWLTLQEIGYRAVVAALSDLAAMGATPRALLSALNVPAEISDAELYSVVDGIAEAQREYGCSTLGGNLARARELSLTTTVIGECEAPALTRSGARAGDGLYLIGTPGTAALGLALLQLDQRALNTAAVARWQRPVARIREGRALRGVASAVIDVSDGLLQDLEHLAEASGVGFELELARLPLVALPAELSARLGCDPLGLALSGGEDYELLFTAATAPGFGTRIGTASTTPGIRARGSDGRDVSLPLAARGFDHFARR